MGPHSEQAAIQHPAAIDSEHVGVSGCSHSLPPGGHRHALAAATAAAAPMASDAPPAAPPAPGDLMDALVFRGKCNVALERVPVPQLEAAGDALVRVDLCAVCGSDLHPYHCREEGLEEGTVMGHEFVGHVVAAGEHSIHNVFA